MSITSEITQTQNPKYTESISPECTKLRLDYDNCFNKWFKNVFLADKDDLENEKICEFEFTKYQKCLFKGIAKIDEQAAAASKEENPKGLLDIIKEAEKEVIEFGKNK